MHACVCRAVCKCVCVTACVRVYAYVYIHTRNCLTFKQKAGSYPSLNRTTVTGRAHSTKVKISFKIS